MKKSTALEILRRYSAYSIVTVGRPDICDTLADAYDHPYYESINLVYLWSLDREEMPFEGPESMEYPVRDHFTMGSLADYLEKDKDGWSLSPWSGKGYLGGSFNGMIRLLPFDLDRVMYLLSNSAIRSCIKWTQDDDADDQKALGKGGLYVDMGDWSPTRIAFGPDILRLDWDCKASAECLRKGVEGGFWIQWDIPKENDDEIDVVAEMGKMLADSASQKLGSDKRDGIIPPENTKEGHNGHLF